MKPKKITKENFRRYGWIIEYPKKHLKSKKHNLFRIVLEEPAHGWRIAYLIVRDKAIDRLEHHPHSFESFEPVCGKSLLFVSSGKIPGRIECFLLNRPIILKKKIWHGIAAVGKEAEVKLTENSRVGCVYYPLNRSEADRLKKFKE